ncbi:hypothetical protein [Vibrio brasiliensis]
MKKYLFLLSLLISNSVLSATLYEVRLWADSRWTVDCVAIGDTLSLPALNGCKMMSVNSGSAYGTITSAIERPAGYISVYTDANSTLWKVIRYTKKDSCPDGQNLNSQGKCDASTPDGFEPPTDVTGCDFGYNPDGSCRTSCEYFNSQTATRRLTWNAYIYGDDVKGAFYGDYDATRCTLNLSGSTACVDVGSNSEITPSTTCSAEFSYSGASCTDAPFYGGTPPETPTDPDKPDKPDNSGDGVTDYIHVKTLSVDGLQGLASQLSHGHNQINKQLSKNSTARFNEHNLVMEQDKNHYQKIEPLLASMDSHLSNIRAKPDSPWTQETLDKLIDGINILKDCAQGAEDCKTNSDNTKNWQSLLTDVGYLSDTVPRIETAIGNQTYSQNNHLSRLLDHYLNAGKSFTTPNAPDFETPFKDGVSALETEIAELNKELETKLSQSPIKLGSMNFQGGGYKGINLSLDVHGRPMSVGFNLLDTINPHLDLIRGVIIFIALLAGAVIILSSGRSS